MNRETIPEEEEIPEISEKKVEEISEIHEQKLRRNDSLDIGSRSVQGHRSSNVQLLNLNFFSFIFS